MAPKVETNPTKIAKLVTFRRLYQEGINLIETQYNIPKTRLRLETILRMNYWQSFADIYPRTKMVELTRGEFLYKDGVVIPADISHLSDQEKLDQVVPFELLTQINKLF